jgi:hypothetical protein
MLLRATLTHVHRSRFSILPFVLLLSAGCGPSHGQAAPATSVADAPAPSRPPSAKDLLEASAPNYASPAGMKQDCLGRLVFDVASPVQWPTFYDGDSSLFSGLFSQRVFDRGDEMRFGRTRIAVIGPADAAIGKDVLALTPWVRIAELKARIKETHAAIGELKKANVKSERWSSDLRSAEEQVQEWETSIKEKQDKFEAFDPGLPNSLGYWSKEALTPDDAKFYSILRAYLMRDHYIYVFESHREIGKATDKDEHKQEFTALLKQFRVRKANEVPTELGVCVPHGFIADDGKTVTDFKQSLRWADAPGVLYTIQTGNVQPRKLKSTVMLAAARAGLGTFGSGEEAQVTPFVTQRIGPRPYKIGGLTSEQGGVALTVKKAGQENYEAYTVFTGYSGWLGTAVLPFILVDMNTIAKHQAPELKQNPPPFKQSMKRLELLLKSMRLRASKPSMPELANLPK